MPERSVSGDRYATRVAAGAPGREERAVPLHAAAVRSGPHDAEHDAVEVADTFFNFFLNIDDATIKAVSKLS